MTHFQRMTAGVTVLLFLGLLSGTGQGAITASDVSHFWSFDTGMGTAWDHVGSSHGRLTGSSSYSAQAKHGGYAYEGNGDSGMMSVVGGCDNLTSNFSVSMWAYIDTAGEGGYGRLFVTATSNSTQGRVEVMCAENHTLKIYTAVGSSSSEFLTSAVPYGEYIHIVVTASPATSGRINLYAYVNGVLVGSKTNMYQPTASSFTLGNSLNDVRTFDGRLDDVTIFNRQLTAAEVSDLYTNMGGTVAEIIPAAAVTASDVAHFWGFGTPAGTVLDFVGDSDGTLTGNSTYSTQGVNGGYAYEGDGNSGMMSISGGCDTLTANFSLSMWVCSDTAGKDGYGILAYVGTADNTKGRININHFDNDTLRVYSANGTLATEFLITPGVGYGQYYHLVVTVSPAASDRVTIAAYVNGVLKNCKTNMYQPSVTSFYLGNAPNDARAFDGRLDEVAIFNRELTAPEVGYLYTGMSGTVAGIIPEPIIAAMPSFNPDGGGYIAESQLVEISCSTPDAEIRYTLDGGIPTQESFLYDDVQKVTVAPGETLSARAFADGYIASPVKSAVYKAYNNPVYISRADGSVSVDGNLSEWQASEFVLLEYPYCWTTPIESAAYAVRWDGTTNQFYVAVKLKDMYPMFRDSYLDWTDQDYIEVYVHTTGEGDVNYEDNQGTAQQYVLGLKTTRTNPAVPAQDIWATLAGEVSGIPNGIGFQAAGVEEFDAFGVATGWVSYEVQITAYHHLDTVTPANSIVSPLSAGDMVGVDVTACDRWDEVTGNYGYGVKSENAMLDKHKNWQHIGVHQLAMHPADFDGDGKFSSGDIDLLFVQVKNEQNDPAFDLTGDGLVNQADMDVLVLTLLQSHYGDANCDGKVDVGDLGILAANYGGAEKTWNLGDFNGDGAVDVGDLGILAANYGASASSFEADYAKVFGTTSVDEEESSNSLCNGLGLPMIVGLALMGLMLVKLDE